MGKKVAGLLDGVVEVHAAAASNSTYDTLCGIDFNDPSIGHMGSVP